MTGQGAPGAVHRWRGPDGGSAAGDAAYRMLVEAVTDISIYLLNPAGLVESWNPGAQRLKGYAEAEVIGTHFSRFYTEEDRRAGLPDLALRQSAEHGTFESEGWRLRKDGTRFWATVVIDPVRDSHGGLLGFAKITRDITEKHQNAQRTADLVAARTAELQAANAALELRTREAEAAVAIKGRFLANMSHELRSPMNGILGMQALLLGTELSELQRDYTNKASNATKSLLRLLDDILDYSKIDARRLVLEQVPFSLGEMARDVADILLISIGEKPIDGRCSLDPDLPDMVVGDGFRLRQVLINLTSNAVKFTAAGAVHLSIRGLSRASGRCMLEFSVRDTGIGISSEQMPMIFESFSQCEISTTRRFGGTGLGLAISQQLVALMGGTIKVESVPGVGSLFAFTLGFDIAPRTGVEADPTTDAIDPPGGSRLSGLRLLVAEDNCLNQEVAEALLTGEGAVVTIAPDGMSAVATALCADPPFDAILMDVQMPNMDGYMASRLLRGYETMRELPILAMTADAMPADREACLAAGMNEHLAKPIDLDAVVASILRHCRKRDGRGPLVGRG